MSGVGVDRASAVMFLETGDPGHNTSTPGDNSGWQYSGNFSTFLGVPIAPHFFITAKHFGGTVGNTFTWHGDDYVTIAVHTSPTTDLAIWEVNHAKPFPTYAPLSTGVADLGTNAMVFGRGTQRGVPVVVSSENKGWRWGPGDDVKRWGRNVVSIFVDGGSSFGELLQCDFNNPGLDSECHVSVGDSGGGLFVLENGLWRLAGVHLSVDGPFRTDSMDSTGFNAALFDAGGMEYKQQESPPIWTAIPEDDDDVASSFYSSRISASMTWITSTASGAGTIPNENFAAWQKLYFTPTQIADPLVSGPLADFDRDGISNVVEFALHLDPIFNEQVTMEAGTGIRGLPLVRQEDVLGNDRLTIEFVRRSAANGSGLTYVPEFSDDLVTWEPAGTESASAINPRWERVKCTDSQTIQDSNRRFARLRVMLAD